MNPVLPPDITLQRDSNQPLFVQLCDLVRQRIGRQLIAPGTRLPASRNLATSLGISRGTVVTAYEQLMAEGYIEGRPGSGFYVRDISHGVAVDASKPAKIGSVDEITEQRTPVEHPGYPDKHLFPARQWARCLARNARTDPAAMAINTSRLGDPRLRRAIAAYLADWRGMSVDPAQILITAGSVDALETCLRTLCRAGQSVALENPCYSPLRHIAENLGAHIQWLPVGADGAQLPAAGSPPRLVVLTPSHQFPLGGAMPVQRRHEYLEWARHNDSWIVEDDYDSEFRYAGRPIPALASLDSGKRTIYVGTFSKVFSVGLRLGYLIMPESLVADFEQTLNRFGVKAALPCQPALADFIESGEFYRHIRRVRRTYHERRRLLIDLLQQKLAPYLEFDDHQAGMLLTARFRKNMDDREIARLCRDGGVNFPALSEYYSQPPAQRGLLLGFCPFDDSEIRNNIEILHGVLKRVSDEQADRKIVA